MNIEDIKKKLEKERLKVQKQIDTIDKSIQSLPDSEIAEEFEGADIMNSKIESFEIKDNMETLLKDINLALLRIKKNKYGVCENCKLNIEPKRLDLYPFAKYCTKCMDEFDNE